MQPQTQNMIIIGLLIAIIICLIVKISKVNAEGFDARCTECAKKFADVSITTPRLCNQYIPQTMSDLRGMCQKAKTLSADDLTKYVNELDIYFSGNPSMVATCEGSGQLAACSAETDEVVLSLKDKFQMVRQEGIDLQKRFEESGGSYAREDMIKALQTVAKKLERITEIGKDYLTSKDAAKARSDLEEVLKI